MAYRRVTVFGGSGFIGRHIVRRLAAEGAVVRVAVRDRERAMFLKPMGDVGQVVPMHVDVRDDELVAAALDGVDAAINLVGILFERGGNRFGRVHAEAAERIARSAAANGVGRLIHMSALGADARSLSDYARSKAAGEARVREAYADATIFRPSVVFGPEDDFFNRFAALARITPALPVYGCGLPKLVAGANGGWTLDLYGKGGTLFQPVYVGDVADAVLAALHRPDSAGQSYDLGGPTVYSFKQILELVLAQIGRRRLLVPLPFWVGSLTAAFLQFLPKPPLTPDQVKLLRRDNVVPDGARTLSDLGIQATAAEAILPTYMDRFRKHGRWSEAGAT